jgi:hypothetical protein
MDSLDSGISAINECHLEVDSKMRVIGAAAWQRAMATVDGNNHKLFGAFWFHVYPLAM